MIADIEQTQMKSHRDENFPVASWLIAPEHRPVILAFYYFVRGADDIADSPVLSPNEKLEGLGRFEAALLGKEDGIAVARPLRAALAERRLSPRHALDLLHAFRMDATKKRYANFDELMHYCAYSAAPVGRFVLDVHGESDATWPANDVLCSGLQIVNHLQDCGTDYRNLDRVYVPLDAMAKEGTDPTALAAPRASPAMLACLHAVAARTELLIRQGSELPRQVRDLHLSLETAVIARLAQTLVTMLNHRDPLSEKVHLTKPGFLAFTLAGIGAGLVDRGRRATLRHVSTMRGV
jgi:hydroxysqualene synthase